MLVVERVGYVNPAGKDARSKLQTGRKETLQTAILKSIHTALIATTPLGNKDIIATTLRCVGALAVKAIIAALVWQKGLPHLLLRQKDLPYLFHQNIVLTALLTVSPC